MCALYAGIAFSFFVLFSFVIGILLGRRSFLRRRGSTMAAYLGGMSFCFFIADFVPVDDSALWYAVLISVTVVGFVFLIAIGLYLFFIFIVDGNEFRKWRLVKLGQCRVCRYNLTGNASGICPECGTAIPEDVRTFHRLDKR